MNSSMSGWSMLRTTILAARRVLPPDLMVPATESAPRMKETGAEGRPPAVAGSGELGSLEGMMAEPEPALQIFPLVLAQAGMQAVEESTLVVEEAVRAGS